MDSAWFVVWVVLSGEASFFEEAAPCVDWRSGFSPTGFYLSQGTGHLTGPSLFVGLSIRLGPIEARPFDLDAESFTEVGIPFGGIYAISCAISS